MVQRTGLLIVAICQSENAAAQQSVVWPSRHDLAHVDRFCRACQFIVASNTLERAQQLFLAWLSKDLAKEGHGNSQSRSDLSLANQFPG
jgi:hypothetical protein